MIDITDFINTVTGTDEVVLTDSIASIASITDIKFTNLVDNSTIYPSTTLYPSETLYPTGLNDYYLRLYSSDGTLEKEYLIPIDGILQYDDSIEIQDGTVYVTQDGVKEELDDKIYIQTFDGSTTINIEIGAATLGCYIEATYLINNDISNVFTPRVEKDASIKLTADEINLEVSKKVGADEII